MDIRHHLACSIALGSLLAAAPAQQGQQPPAKPPAATPQPGPAPASQDPEKATPVPVEETAQQRIEKLEAELQKLQQEIEYVRERASKGSMARMVQDKLAHRELSLKTIDAGASKAAGPISNLPAQPQPVQRARLMSDSEKQKMAPDVVYLVAGQPIRQEAIEQLVEYQRSYASAGEDNPRQTRAVMELLRTAAAQAAFSDTIKELQKRMQELQKEIEAGASFEDLAKQNSQGANAEKGGDISPVTRNSYHGLQVERMAFTTKEGLSPIFFTPMGLSMLWVKSVEKGATPEQDQVSAQLLTLNYAPDITQVHMAATKVMTGQVDLVVRDEDAMQMLPPMFRPMPLQPAETDAEKLDKAPKKTDGQQAADEKAGEVKAGDVKAGGIKPNEGKKQ